MQLGYKFKKNKVMMMMMIVVVQWNHRFTASSTNHKQFCMKLLNHSLKWTLWRRLTYICFSLNKKFNI